MPNPKIELHIDSKALNTLLNGTEVQKAAIKKANMGLAVARATAPKNTRRFASGFQVKPAKVQGGRRNEDRAGAVLVNTAPYSAYVHKTRQDNFMKELRRRMDGKS